MNYRFIAVKKQCRVESSVNARRKNEAVSLVLEGLPGYMINVEDNCGQDLPTAINGGRHGRAEK